MWTSLGSKEQQATEPARMHSLAFSADLVPVKGKQDVLFSQTFLFDCLLKRRQPSEAERCQFKEKVGLTFLLGPSSLPLS